MYKMKYFTYRNSRHSNGIEKEKEELMDFIKDNEEFIEIRQMFDIGIDVDLKIDSKEEHEYYYSRYPLSSIWFFTITILIIFKNEEDAMLFKLMGYSELNTFK